YARRVASESAGLDRNRCTATAVFTSTVSRPSARRLPMRLSLVIVLAVAIAVAVYVATRPDDDTRPQEAGAATLVGDSLNVGIEPYLGDALPGWRLDAHDRVGRATQEGIDELRSLGGGLAPVVVVSLGTNDADGSEPEFRRLVDEAVAIVGPRRCLVWATVVRDGTPRAGFNRALEDARSAHRNVRLVDWAAMVGASGPRRLGARGRRLGARSARAGDRRREPRLAVGSLLPRRCARAAALLPR